MWYVNPQFVGTGLIPRPVEELDRLLREGKTMAIGRLAVAAFEATGLDTDSAVQACRQFEGGPLEDALDHIWRVFKRAMPSAEGAVLALIADAEAAGE